MILSALVFFSIVTITAPIIGKYIGWIFFEDPQNNLITDSPKGVIKQQTWKKYFTSLMIFNLICIVCTFLIIFFQKYLPTGESLTKELDFAASLNAAVSFSTSTFWQSHNPENQLTVLSQIFALTMQNFLSGATSIAVFIAFVRGIINNANPYIGNFYNDFVRILCFLLLPAAFIISLFLIAGGVPHDFTGNIDYINLEGKKEQMFIGPAAGQIAIKNIAANGGSIFSAGAAHPFEAPSRLVIILNLFLTVITAISLIFTYGFAVKATNFSWSLYWIVVLVIGFSLHVLSLGENDYGIPLILADRIVEDNFNYTGKELIYDKFPSLMWVLSITMSSNGTTNACLENYSPLSTIVLFSNLVMSKFIMEGVGSGFFAMLAYLIVSVFLRGLITGNNSNFFGKKITINEINYVIIVFLIMPVGVLLFTGITFALPATKELITYQGSQAVTDIAYNFVSSFTNNGSNFAGLNTANNYFNYMTALAMFKITTLLTKLQNKYKILTKKHYQNVKRIARTDFNKINSKAELTELDQITSNLPLMLPSYNSYISSNYGIRKHPGNKKYKMHCGIDLVANYHAPIYASATGKVSFVGHQNGYGTTVEISHENNIKTKYTHLKKTFVKKGQKVIRSQAIALQGRSGNAHGDHLHFEIHIAGKHVNPYDFIGHNYECFKR
ncbi:MAG: potassium-transporting ATPase subunit KdpA [Rickettsiaceae bacterium]|nr:potassium-transporting ATPase subunit KdpA [Rickettsiaceae bacterium]